MFDLVFRRFLLGRFLFDLFGLGIVALSSIISFQGGNELLLLVNVLFLLLLA